MARVSENEVVTKDDFRCKILQSLMPHVSSVLGPDEAAKYDRVADRGTGIVLTFSGPAAQETDQWL